MDNTIPKRDHFIDSLRGLAILVMMLTHVTVFYPSSVVARTLWDFSHFSVALFIFCSVYLFLQKQLAVGHHSIAFVPYIKKRFVRLVMPYYLFLPFFLLTVWFLKPQTITGKYLLQSIFLIGGVDISWLVLLFLYFAFLLPPFLFVLRRKVLFWLWFALALGSSILYLWYIPPFSYKFIMWLPWSLMLFFSLLFLRWEHKKRKRVVLFVLLTVLFLALYSFRFFADQSVILIHNKYPPNLFYLSYGMAVLMLLSFVLRKLQSPILLSVIHYFSKYSYELFFIHYLFLTIFAAFLPQLKWHWLVFYLILVAVTVAAEQLLRLIKRKLKVLIFAS